MLIKVKSCIIVEGKYDKIKLSSIVDANIIQTDGFRIFKDKEKRELIKILAEKVGLIIMTDSDVAGFKIRNYIKSFVKKGKIYNIYIPDIFGKESRKFQLSKEGKLGVEGIPVDILVEKLKKFDQNSEIILDPESKINKIDLFEDGLFGTANSKIKREKLLKYLDLPLYISTNSLLDVLNSMLSYDEYKIILSKL